MKSLFLIGALSLAAPVLADETVAAPAPAQPAPLVKEKRVCRHEQVLGSNIPARICLTRAQWIEFEKHYADVDQSFISRRKAQFNATPTQSSQLSPP